MAEKNVTYADIARYTNFSKTTISRYFNNPDSLKIENQEIIAQALIDLNYQKNKLAKILSNGKSEFIGVIIPNMFLHYYSEVLNQILTTYETFDYKFLVFIGSEDLEKEKKYIEELMSYKIEGLIILSHTIPSEQLKEYDVPIVTIEREDKYTHSVNTDNYQGACEATELLIENNCDILIHVNSEIADGVPAKRRIEGFIDTCEAVGKDYRVIINDLGTNFEEGNKKVIEIIDKLEEEYPDKKIGLFLSNDTYANMFLNVIFRRYGKLPDKYEIIGFDDSPIATQAIIPISTVAQQIDVLVQEAMQILFDLMQERKKKRPQMPKEKIHKNIKPKLVERNTTTKKELP